MLDVARQFPALSKGDVALITPYMEKEKAAWTKAAEAYQKGDEQSAFGFVKDAQKMEARNDLWNQRLSARMRQAQTGEYLPASEDAFDILVEDRQDNDVKEIEAFMEAKKRRSEAYGRLADATLPTADRQTLFKLKDETDDADVEVAVAEMKRDWARDDRSARMYIMNDPSVSSPQLTVALTRVQEWRRQYEDTYRQGRRLQLELERQKRCYDDVISARNKSFNEAKAAKHGADQKKQERPSFSPFRKIREPEERGHAMDDDGALAVRLGHRRNRSRSGGRSGRPRWKIVYR
jgi:hypothetical protein